MCHLRINILFFIKKTIVPILFFHSFATLTTTFTTFTIATITTTTTTTTTAVSHKTMSDLVSFDKVKQEINDSYDNLYCQEKTNNKTINRVPVCIVCDRLLNARNRKHVTSNQLLKNQQHLQVPSFVSEELNDKQLQSLKTEYSVPGFKNMLLSPRTSQLIPRGVKSSPNNPSYFCCSECKYYLSKDKMPLRAIANGYAIGSTPKCIEQLTDFELSYLCPVKSFGYCFTYTGGKQKQLNGYLSYYKVSPSSIATSAAHLSALELNNHVVVVLSGKMTAKQRQRAIEKSTLRVGLVMEAIAWLIEHNQTWKYTNYDTIKKLLEKADPKIIENIELQDDSDSNKQSNIEKSETFTVFYPDGTMNSLSGGQKNHAEFRKMVADMHTSDASKEQIYLVNNYTRTFCRDFEEDNFVNAHIAQFPHGIGGFEDVRLDTEGARRKTKIVDYVQHISRLSPLQFHRPLFVLSLFSLYQKQQLVQSATFKYRGKETLSTIVNNLTEQDLKVAAANRKHGSRAGSAASNKLLDGVDAVSRALPHSPAACAAARGNMEALQHEYGPPSWFVTVTPDDENSYLVQVYCMHEIDDNTPVKDLSDDDLRARTKQRRELRIKFPGLCSLVFEDVMDIVFKKVLGWDMNKKCKTECKSGYILGEPIAATLTVEEQGRKTLHGHIIVWTKNVQQLTNTLRNGTTKQKGAAKQRLCKIVDNVSTNSLLSDPTAQRQAWGHGCTYSDGHPILPRPVDDQALRNLRHAKSWKETQGICAECPACPKTWTSDELIQDYLTKGLKIPNLSSFPDTSTRRLEAIHLQYQKRDGDAPPTQIGDAAWSNHRPGHTKSCFPAKTKKRKKPCAEDWECRHRIPKEPCHATTINTSEPFPTWSVWSGGNAPDGCMETYEVITKRGNYDLFQNNAFRPVGHSKIGSNTNVSLMMPGPFGVYSTKYVMKDNKIEECMEYKQCQKRMRHTLNAARVYEDDAKEGFRWLVSAAFAHNDANIVGAPMAAYLSRNKTRFHFSHDFAWVPLEDLNDLLHGASVEYNAHPTGNNMLYYENFGLHYLCRNPAQEYLCPYDFYAEYEVITRNQANRETFEFIDTGTFQHPSIIKKKNQQLLRKRDKRQLPKIKQKLFPDTASFNNLLDPTVPVTVAMEAYARTILLLFHTYRTNDDVILNGTSVNLLRHLVTTNTLHPKAPAFLQNIQDARYNFLRRRSRDDALQRKTQIYIPPKYEKDLLSPMEDREEEEAKEPDHLDESEAQLYLQMLEMEAKSSSITEPSPDPTLSGFSFRTLRDSGSYESGYKQIADTSLSSPHDAESFLNTNASRNPAEDNSENNNERESTNITKQKIQIALSKRTRRVRKIPKMDEPFRLIDANGSAASIIDWGKVFRKDKLQRKAFQAITASFVLACMREALTQEKEHLTRDHATFPQMVSLRKLAFGLDQKKWAKHKNDQLLLFLHGPGGSGKSTVIDMVLMYCKEYYEHLDQSFTERTIIVSAMSGVAATLIMGETTHSSAHLNRKKTFDATDLVPYEDTKLLIVDEISFAREEQIDKMYSNFKILKEDIHQHYGGINVVFCGDFRQLQPVNGNFIYDTGCVSFEPVINMFIELNGLHRFSKDMQWGQLLRRFRNGNPTRADIEFLNKHCLYQSNALSLPQDIQYATGNNRDRVAINVATFEQRCLRVAQMQNGKLTVDDGMLVLSDNIRLGNNGQPLSAAASNTFWQECGEDHVKMERGRMDPVLRLYHNCPLMMTHNENVPCGEANGTRALAQQVVLKCGETARWVPMRVGDKMLWLRAVWASQVHHITLKHCNDKVQPAIFHMKPKDFSFKAKMPQPKIGGIDTGTAIIHLHATQLPLISNTATTGHKLQGATVDQLFVHDWAYKYKNWPYVVLSRVKTLGGLIFRRPLSLDLSKYALPHAYTTFINSFTDRIPEHYTDDMSYDEIQQTFCSCTRINE